MTTRHESVCLDLEGDYTGDVLKAAAATKVLDHSIQSLGKASVKQSALTQTTIRDTDRLSSSLKRSESGLDSYTARLGLMTKAGLALAPAFSGISATAVPALSGLANILGITTVAAGVTAIAVNGVADASKALAKAELSGSAKDIEEAQRQLRLLAPEAASFVLELNKMIPALREVRNTGAAGIFDGAGRALDELDDALPRLEQFVGTYSDVIGDLIAGGAVDLTSGRWTEFVNFLEGEARPTLTTIGGAVGDLAHGMSELWMAMDPANDDLLGGLAKGADVFDKWASGLKDSEGFEKFLAYVQETGPEVVDTAISLAEAVVAIGTAAAPLSGPVLDGIQALAGAVESIASSPRGGARVGFAATSSVASLAKQGASAVASSPIGAGISDAISNAKDLAAAFKTTTEAETESAEASAQNAEEKASLADTVEEAAEKAGELTGANEAAADSDKKATAATEKNTKSQQSRAAALRQSAAALGKQAALMGGVMFASSGMADKMGMANTATMALTGAMIGGGAFGAVAGGLVGAFLDVQASAKSAKDTVKGWNDALESNDLPTIITSFKALSDSIAETNAQMGSLNPTSIKQYLGMTVSKKDGVMLPVDFQKKTQKESADFVNSVGYLMPSLGLDVHLQNLKDGVLYDMKDIEKGALQLQPVLDRMGVTWEQFAEMGELDGSNFKEINEFAARFNEELAYMNSNAARVDAVGAAIANLDDQFGSAEMRAAAFGEALSGALQPGLSLSEQTDNWIKSIRTLTDDLSDNSKTLRGNSDAALQNREAIRGRVEQLQSTLTAQAAAGASSEDLARSLRQQRETLIGAGEAAGISRRQMRAYLRQLGLTPELVRTTIEAAGIEVVSRKVKTLRRGYASLPKWIQTDIKANGVPKTTAEVDKLVKQFGLTEKQRTALIKLKDAGAKKGTTDIIKLLDKAGKKKATPEVKVDATQANTALAGVKSRLDGLHDKYVNVYVTEHKKDANANGGLYTYANSGLRFADGGYGVDGRYYQRQSQIVPGGANILWGEQETGWEAYISGKPSQRERNREIWAETGRRLGYDVEDGSLMRFADGGRLGGSAMRADGGGSGTRAAREAASALKGLAKEAKASESSLKKLKRRRESLLERRSELSDSVSTGLVSPLWEGDPWSDRGDPFSVLRGDIADAKAFNAGARTLRRKGLTGAALAEILRDGDVDRVRQMAGMTRSSRPAARSPAASPTDRRWRSSPRN